MKESDWIALVSVVVSLTAAGISIWQARTAGASAKAAKEQAEAAVRANELTQQQMDREEARAQQAAADAEAAALLEAEKVHLGFSSNGGSVVVEITNNGVAPITEVELLKVEALDEGPWAGWTVNRNMSGPMVQTKRSILRSHEDMEVATWLLDRDGQRVPQLPRSVRALVRFRDQDGQWWQVTGGGEPPVPADPPTT